MRKTYPISDQNGSKTIPFGAANAYLAYIREYPPGVQTGVIVLCSWARHFTYTGYRRMFRVTWQKYCRGRHLQWTSIPSRRVKILLVALIISQINHFACKKTLTITERGCNNYTCRRCFIWIWSFFPVKYTQSQRELLCVRNFKVFEGFHSLQ